MGYLAVNVSKMRYKTEKSAGSLEYVLWGMEIKELNKMIEKQMDSVSVLGIYNYTRPEAEYMSMGDKCPGLEHCFGLMWKILAGGKNDDSEMNGFLRSRSQL